MNCIVGFLCLYYAMSLLQKQCADSKLGPAAVGTAASTSASAPGGPSSSNQIVKGTPTEDPIVKKLTQKKTSGRTYVVEFVVKPGCDVLIGKKLRDSMLAILPVDVLLVEGRPVAQMVEHKIRKKDSIVIRADPAGIANVRNKVLTLIRRKGAAILHIFCALMFFVESRGRNCGSCE